MSDPGQDTKAAYRTQAICFWEGRRLWYMGLLTLVSLMGIVSLLTLDEFQRSCLLSPLVIMEGVVCIIAANICYTFGYVPELLVMGGKLEQEYFRYRKFLWWAGTLLSMLLAFVSVLVGLRFICLF